MENKQELKKCPFCGGEGKEYIGFVMCLGCGVEYPPIYINGREEMNKEQAIKAWNTRAKQVDERQEIDVDAVKLKEAVDIVKPVAYQYCEDEDKVQEALKPLVDLAEAYLVNTFKPKVEVTEDELFDCLPPTWGVISCKYASKKIIQLLKDKGVGAK